MKLLRSVGGRDGGRGATNLVPILLLVALAVVGTAVLTVGVFGFLPEEPSVRPEADFVLERDDGDLVADPQYMTEGVEFDLLINGREAFTWRGEQTNLERRLSCLNEGDSITIRADAEGRRTYLMERREVSVPTACPFSGTASRFAFARVGDRTVPLKDTQYSFRLAIDPDGPNSVNGDVDFPTTNPWIYVQRYDRTIEGLSPPVYVVVFADNVGSVSDWESEPSRAEREEMADSYEISGDQVVVTASGVEPTDDVYMVFKPGCSASKLEFIEMEGGYNNQILLDGTELFRTDSASSGTVYTVKGVECT